MNNNEGETAWQVDDSGRFLDAIHANQAGIMPRPGFVRWFRMGRMVDRPLDLSQLSSVSVKFSRLLMPDDYYNLLNHFRTLA